MCLLIFVGGVLRTSIVHTAIPEAFIPLIDSNVELDGLIVSLPDMRETSDRLTIETESEGAVTRMIAVAPVYPTFSIGDRVQVSGMLSLPEPFETNGGRVFRYDRFLAKDGIFALVSPASVVFQGKDPSWIMRLRALLQDGTNSYEQAIARALPEPYISLAVGITMGGKQGLGPALLDAFTIAGLLQVVVLSGYNVMIVAEGMLIALSRLPRGVALLIASIGIILFVIAAGASSSAVRAGIMALLALLARATGRTYAVLRALTAALVIMLLLDPLLLLSDPGFQLSFLATIGLIIGSPIVSAKFLWVENAFIRDLIATTVAAQVAVLRVWEGAAVRRGDSVKSRRGAH